MHNIDSSNIFNGIVRDKRQQNSNQNLFAQEDTFKNVRRMVLNIGLGSIK